MCDSLGATGSDDPENEEGSPIRSLRSERGRHFPLHERCRALGLLGSSCSAMRLDHEETQKGAPTARISPRAHCGLHIFHGHMPQGVEGSHRPSGEAYRSLFAELLAAHFIGTQLDVWSLKAWSRATLSSY